MLVSWLMLFVFHTVSYFYLFVHSSSDCNEVKVLESVEDKIFLHCETFCITHECKQCRKVCLSDHCESSRTDNKVKDCRIQEFFTTNCSKARSRKITGNNFEQTVTEKICEFETGYLPPALSKPGDYLYQPVDLSLQCGEGFPLSVLLYKIRGTGHAQLSFYVNKPFSSRQENILTAYFYLHPYLMPDVEFQLFYTRYETKVSLKAVYEFWIKIISLHTGHTLFLMGEGDTIGQGTLFNVSKVGKYQDISSVTAFNIQGNIDWTFNVQP